MSTCLAAHTDDQVRALADGETEDRDAAKAELVKRGLATSPESLAKLAASRKKYLRWAAWASGDWGYAG